MTSCGSGSAMAIRVPSMAAATAPAVRARLISELGNSGRLGNFEGFCWTAWSARGAVAGLRMNAARRRDVVVVAVGFTGSGRKSRSGKQARTAQVTEDEIRYKSEADSMHIRSDNEDIDGLVPPEAQGETESTRMNRICDKLVDVFLVEKNNPEEWHIYLAVSKEWPNIRPHFFSRCQVRASHTEDPQRRTNLLKLTRRLKELDEDMQRHDKILALIEESPSKLDAIVSRQRKDFTEHFFEHLRIRIHSSFDDQNRREELSAIAKKCLATVQEYDKNSKDFMSLSAAQMKFDDIVKSPSIEVATKKIEYLAKKGELDSSLMLLLSKAYAASKESTLMKEEAKDVMLQLYNAARGNMSRLVPKEVRILRYLLSMNDPAERSAEMRNAFIPGLELEGKDVDQLHTTPESLLMTIQNLLDAVDTNRRGALLKEARKLIQPSVLGRLRAIKQELESQYM